MKQKSFSPVRVALDVNSKSFSLEKLRQLLPFASKVSEAYSALKQGYLSEEILVQLVNKPTLVRDAALDRAISKAGDNEMLQEMSLEWINSKFQAVVQAVQDFKRQFSIGTHSPMFNVLIQVEFFGFDEKGNPFIKPEVEQQLEDHFSIFLNSEEDLQFAEHAKVVVEALEKLKTFMLQAGYPLDSQHRLVADSGLIVERDYNQFEIDFETFDFWRTMRERQANLKTA
jgi:hypothetical protein